MPPRHPPRLWLMTDERIGEALWDALARLPRGSGIVFRHSATPPRERRALYERVRRIARARRLTLLLAATPHEAAAWRADGVHGRDPRRAARPLLRGAPVHDARERIAAARAGAVLTFVSPLFATRSHPGARTLGPAEFARLSRGVAWPIALGGVDTRRFRTLRSAYGWAGIDALCGAEAPGA